MRTILMVLLLAYTGFVNGQCSDSAVNCTGECGQYIDDNGDGFCDDSFIDSSKIQTQAAVPKPDNNNTAPPVTTNPETTLLQQETVLKVSTSHKAEPKPDLRERPETTKPETPIIATEVQEPVMVEANQLAYLQPRNAVNAAGAHRRGKRYDYSFLSIALPLVAAYALLSILSSRKVIHRSTFLRIWNTALLITFLVTGLLGLVLTAKLVYDIQLPEIKTIYTLHVDFGVAMAVISLFHLALHWKYYMNMVKR